MYDFRECFFCALRSRIVVPMGQEEGKKATEKGRKERSWSFQNRFLSFL